MTWGCEEGEDEKWLGKFEFGGEGWGMRPEVLVNG